MELEWVRIPAGEFTMGISVEESIELKQLHKSDCFLQEAPQRQIYLDAFEISRYPVTNSQYTAFLEATGYPAGPSPYLHMYMSGKNKEWAEHPVVWVSWYDALAFCQWAGCRLPTEAEWEKAARGPDGLRYPWGNVWQENHCNSSEAKIGITTPVGQFPQGVSPYGVLDMAGNVWEWTDGWLTTDVLSPKSAVTEGQTDERLDQFHHLPVLRGGAISSDQITVRTTFRFVRYRPWDWGDWVGFRCVRLQRNPRS